MTNDLNTYADVLAKIHELSDKIDAIENNPNAGELPAGTIEHLLDELCAIVEAAIKSLKEELDDRFLEGLK